MATRHQRPVLGACNILQDGLYFKSHHYIDFLESSPRNIMIRVSNYEFEIEGFCFPFSFNLDISSENESIWREDMYFLASVYSKMFESYCVMKYFHTMALNYGNVRNAFEEDEKSSLTVCKIRKIITDYEKLCQFKCVVDIDGLDAYFDLLIFSHFRERTA